MGSGCDVVHLSAVNGMVSCLRPPRQVANVDQNGGLFCDNDGSIKKPFPDKPYCVDGTGAMKCTNKASAAVAWCQTVLPGNEAMLIPTSIESVAELAVPGPDYWLSTAAQYLQP